MSHAEPREIQRAYRLRPLVWLGLALTLLAAGAGIVNLRADFTPQKIFESSDEKYAELKHLQEVFGRDDNLLVVHVQTTTGLFTTERLAFLRTLSDALRRVPGVVRVEDLSTLWLVRPGDSMPSAVLDPERSLGDVQQFATTHPALRERFVSKGGRAALVVVRLDPKRSSFDGLKPMVEGCIGVISEAVPPAGVELTFTGIPAARVLIAERLIEDQLTFIPWCTGVFTLILWLCFRDWRAVAVPLFAVFLSTFYVAGLLGATGEPINIINNVLPTLIFVIAMSDAIHVIGRYRRELAAGVDQRKALWVTLRHLAIACLLTSMTTAMGFASLAVAEVSLLQRFGFYAAGGVMIAYAVTVLFVPLIFSYLSPRLGEAPRRVDELLDRAACAMGNFSIRHAKPVLVGTAIVAGLAVWSSSGIEVENNVYEAFPTEDPITEANRRIERDFAGIVSLSIVLSWDEGTRVLTPEVLNYLAELSDYLREDEDLQPLSMVDLIQEFNVALHRGDPAYRKVPETAEACMGALFAINATAQASGRSLLLDRVWAPAERMTRISALIDDLGSRALNKAFARIERRLVSDSARLQALGLRASLSGDGPVASRGIDRLITDLFSSLLLAFGVIFPVMCLLLRSVRAGLICMIPNVLPLLLTLGFMAAVGMDLRLTSVIVFTVSLGLAVDDTIHFMARFGEEWRNGGVGPDAYEQALTKTFRGTGAAILLTTGLLASGFSALLLSRFPISQTFALCMEITVVGALVADMVVLPAVLVTLKPFPPRSNEER
jgi:uncharacterized protein